MKKFYPLLFAVVLLIASIFVTKHFQYPQNSVQIGIKINAPKTHHLTLYYASHLVDYTSANVVEQTYQTNKNNNEVYFNLPKTIDISKLKLRLDNQYDTVRIKEVIFKNDKNDLIQYSNSLLRYFEKNEPLLIENNAIKLFSKAKFIDVEINDLKPVFDQLSNTNSFWIYRIGSIVFFLIALFVVFYNLYFNAFKILKTSTSKTVVFIIVFSFLFALPFIFQVCSREESGINLENRTKSEFPTFDIKHFSKFLPSIITYVNDNFSGRNELIKMNKVVKSDLFHTTNFGKNVVFGKDQWRFYFHDNVKSYNVNSFPLTDAELKKIALDQVMIEAWLKLQNIDYYIFLPPSSMTVYPEYLPDWFMKCNEFTKREQIINYLKLHTDLKIILPDEAIRKHKKEHKLYYNTDSHWTFFGAYYAYEHLINELRISHPNIPAIPYPLDSNNFIPSEFTQGDLLKLTGTTGQFYELDTVINPKSFDFQYLIGEEGTYKDMNEDSSYLFSYNPILKTRNKILKDAPNLTMYRDSYMNATFKHISNHFNTVSYIWELNVKPELKIDKGTNIFIYEIVEHQMPGMLPLSNVIPDELKKKGIKVSLH